MAEADAPATEALARFALDAPLARMPAEVHREGVRSLINILGCTLGGARHDAVERTWKALAPFAGREQSSLVGRPERTDALTAALINTLASSINTFDDTHAEAIVHPSGPVIGAVLAEAELRPVSGAELLAAFIVGVEATCRLSKAVSVAPAKGNIAWSQTGIACGIGAALAVARLMRLDVATAATAVGIAAAQSSGIRALHGSHSTAMMPANAGQVGLRAAHLAAAGVTSSRTAIEARYGFAECFSLSPHLGHVTVGLGQHWDILGNTYKPYPCGIVIHPLIDAALDIAREEKSGADAIAKVAIRANPVAMALCWRRHPKDELEAQVSLYQWVAAALARGRAGIPEGTDAAVADPVIAALRDRIEVETDAAIPHDGAEMTVTLGNGRAVSRSIRNCIGSRGRPMTDAELDAKFRLAAESILPSDRTDALLKSVRGVESLADAAVLARGARSA
jgi:2-methylcitrate dehydratase PrpD